MVGILLEAGADGLIRNSNGQTASGVAYDQGYDGLAVDISRYGLCTAMERHDMPSVLEYVHALGSADVQCEGMGMYSPLVVAVKQSDAHGVLQLLELGADPSLAEADGWTPLMFAALRKNEEVLQLLLQAGADRKAVNHKGLSVLALLEGKEGYDQVLRLLMQDPLTNEARDKTRTQHDAAASVGCAGDELHRAPADSELVAEEVAASTRGGDISREAGAGTVRTGQKKEPPVKPSLWNLFGLF
jgi:hypothetical protein